MKTLHELYLILWMSIKDKNYICGLCEEINSLYFGKEIPLITEKECTSLKNHFKSQKPSSSLHSEFLSSPTWYGGAWWWNIREDNNPINRKAFIQKMIQITKE